MTAYNVQNPAHAGLTLTTAAPVATGNTTPCGNGVGLLVINPTGGTSVTVSAHVPAAITYDGLNIGGSGSNGSRTLTVASPGYGILPLVAATLMDPATGLATFDVSGTLTNVLCAVVSISS
jgi:hypothetical protein